MLVSKSSQLYGILVLVFVNIVWVAASEITRYLFIDLGFKRPFFFTYAKSCMLSLFLLRYACTWQSKLPKKSGQVHYSRLDANHNNSSGEEDDEDAYEAASLTAAEFEPIPVTDVESTTSEFPAQMGITPATDVESIPGAYLNKTHLPVATRGTWLTGCHALRSNIILMKWQMSVQIYPICHAPLPFAMTGEPGAWHAKNRLNSTTTSK